MTQHDDNCGGTCPEHSGMKGGQKLIIWLVGLLIALLISVGGAQLNMLTSLSSDMAVVQTKLAELDYRYASSERMRLMEQEIATLKVLCRIQGNSNQLPEMHP